MESEPPYLYVRGNPVNLVDPSGFQSPDGTPQPQPTEISVPNRGPTPTPQPPWPYCLSELGSNPPDPPEYCVPPPQPPPSPPNDCACKDAGVRRIPASIPGVTFPAEVIVLPSGTPTKLGPFQNEDAATVFGIGAVAFDVVEASTAGLVLPVIPTGFAVLDTVVGFGGSVSVGETYLAQRPHPCLPPMVVLGQDALVPGGDAMIAGIAEPVFTIGGFVGGAEIFGLPGMMFGAVGGYNAAKSLDVSLSVASGYYDAGRLPDAARIQLEQGLHDIPFVPDIPINEIPTRAATAIFWEDYSPHFAILYYEQE